ncbi:MAG: disulfide bond formation protein B [Woeseiaceae bacterium]
MSGRFTSRRTLNVAGFAACAAMMVYALYAEYQLLLQPCPLCSFQRLAVIAVGLVFLLVALHGPDGRLRYVYALLIALCAAAGIGIAARHVWLQHLPADQVPSCGPGLDYLLDSFPLGEALRLVFSGSGECATTDWQFLGLSMPAWVLISLLVLGTYGLWNNLRR